MAENNHVNSRLFKSILEIINDFQNNYKKYSLENLNKTILDIESLIFSLEDISDDLRNEMLQSWGMAEDVYSYAVTCNNKMVDENGYDMILKSFHRLKSIVASQLLIHGH